MNTEEILDRLKSLLNLHKMCGCTYYSDEFRYQQANGWPVVIELQTPLGSLTVESESGDKVPFLVSSHFALVNRVHLNDDFDKVLDNIGAMLTLRVDAADLTVGVKYRVVISGDKMVYADSDETAECYTKESDNVLLALNRPIFNDTDDSFDFNSDFTSERWQRSCDCITAPSDDNRGFQFIIRGAGRPCIDFDLAWVNAESIGKDICWDALTYYLT